MKIKKLPDGYWISFRNVYFILINWYEMGNKLGILPKESWGKFYKGFGFNLGKLQISFLKYSFV